MKSWEAAYGAALELSQKTGVRHRVYKDPSWTGGWFISRRERLEDVYSRVQKDVADRWKVYEKFRLVQHKDIGWTQWNRVIRSTGLVYIPVDDD